MFEGARLSISTGVWNRNGDIDQSLLGLRICILTVTRLKETRLKETRVVDERQDQIQDCEHSHETKLTFAHVDELSDQVVRISRWPMIELSFWLPHQASGARLREFFAPENSINRM